MISLCNFYVHESFTISPKLQFHASKNPVSQSYVVIDWLGSHRQSLKWLFFFWNGVFSCINGHSLHNWSVELGGWFDLVISMAVGTRWIIFFPIECCGCWTSTVIKLQRVLPMTVLAPWRHRLRNGELFLWFTCQFLGDLEEDRAMHILFVS